MCNGVCPMLSVKPTKILSFVVLIISGMVLSSCDDHERSDPDPDPEQNESFTVDDFPNEVGNYWSYAVTLDSSLFDLLSIQVLDDTVVAGADEALIWLVYGHYEFPRWNLAVARTDTILDLWFGASYYWRSSRFVFPLTEGRSWTGSQISDTSEVEFLGEIVTAAGTFQNAYLVRNRLAGDEMTETQETWLVPGVGIVKRRWVWFEEVTWELINYEIE